MVRCRIHDQKQAPLHCCYCGVPVIKGCQERWTSKEHDGRFEVLTAMLLKIEVSWDASLSLCVVGRVHSHVSKRRLHLHYQANLEENYAC